MGKYCFEIYTLNPETNETGWDIVNVEVIADSQADANNKIKNYPLFDCVITCNDWFQTGNKDWPLWDGEKHLER